MQAFMGLAQSVFRWLFFVGLCSSVGGCHLLEPKPINRVRNNLPKNLIADHEPQFERGQKRPIVDGFGWLWGIPSKITLWDRRMENHSISNETEMVMAQYLQANDLTDVKVRLNQYRPGDDWRRLVKNKSVAWPWRYTFGTVATLGETIVPGRLFGGDHFNPYTATIHLYSDVPAIALHEAAHAKDFSNRKYPGTYAAAYALPLVPLWHEREATNDILAYTKSLADSNPEDIAIGQEAYHILFPAYGTYFGNAAGYAAPAYSLPLYVGGVLAGHANGRMRAPDKAVRR
jgi:hypothetical protein